MNIMNIRNPVITLKTDITENEGQKIIVKRSAGRGKLLREEGTIEKAYPNFFRVVFNERTKNETYTYSDVLTRNVELELFDGMKYNPVKPVIIDFKKNKAILV